MFTEDTKGIYLLWWRNYDIMILISLVGSLAALLGVSLLLPSEFAEAV